MKIEIKTSLANTMDRNYHAFCAQVYLNDKWFKEITSTEPDKERFELECFKITLEDLMEDDL